MATPSSGICGYCQSVLSPDAAIAECSMCGTKQHRECWDEYGGCVLPGCTGSDKHRDLATEPTTPAAESGGKSVLIAAATILLVGALGATGFVLASAGGKGPPTATSQTALDQQIAKEEEADAEREKAAEKNRDPDDPKNVRTALKRMIVNVHRPINEGDWERSFKFLSSRKQREKGSASGWQSAYSGSWDSSAVLELGTVSISGVNVKTRSGKREAEFMLAITTSGGHCYRGTTWAVRERGEWGFDPGFDNRPGRQGADQMEERSGPC